MRDDRIYHSITQILSEEIDEIFCMKVSITYHIIGKTISNNFSNKLG